jgi:hypothetical protein
VIEITKFKPLDKNTLKGFLTVRMTNVGIEIRDIALQEKNGKRWLNMPSRSFTDANGKQSYSYVLDFFDEEKKEFFQREVLRMLDGGHYGTKSQS